MLQIHAVKAFNDNYIWLIQSAENQDVLIVDPGDAGPVINFIEKNDLHPAAILVTHHHNDHVGGIRRLDDLYDLVPRRSVADYKERTIETLVDSLGNYLP